MASPVALVTGSEGNIGQPLVRYLSSLGYKVVETDVKAAWRPGYVMADLRNAVDLLAAFDLQPSVVFHLGAMVSRVTCEQAASMAVDVNLVGTQNVLELVKRTGARLVYMSTSEVYGPDLEVMDERGNVSPNNRYGMTKLLSESLVRYEVVQHGLSAVILRPFMMYDENEDLGDHRSAMIRFATNLALGRPIEVHRGSARGWFHVTDAMRAIAAAASVDEFSIINIGSPDIRPMEQLAEMIRVELNASPDLVHLVDIPERMTSVKNPSLDLQREVLGVTPEVSLEEGVRRVCESVVARLRSGGQLLSNSW